MDKLVKINVYGMTQQGQELLEMFFYDEIDEETYELQKEFYKEELVEKASGITEAITWAEKLSSGMKVRIDEMKESKEKFDNKLLKAKNKIRDCMLANGYEIGKTKGIPTVNGTMYLHKATKTIKPDVNEVLEKYKTYKIKEIKLTSEEYNQIPDWLREKIEVKEIGINKELYELEQKVFEKEHTFSLQVK